MELLVYPGVVIVTRVTPSLIQLEALAVYEEHHGQSGALLTLDPALHAVPGAESIWPVVKLVISNSKLFQYANANPVVMDFAKSLMHDQTTKELEFLLRSGVIIPRMIQE